ncbi:MAG: hypothetical protein MK212_13910 [Saprospiraceae bacterium]|nr:hypothetical protein [Saprospiraceae bacterium]
MNAKHKTWIDHYENNLEQLAEKIGDLRYDTLSEFLDLLALKIKKDGDKDASRGRTQLARQLYTSSEALRESSKAIQKAWVICEPYMYPEDIRQKVKAEFKEKSKIKTVFQLLSDFGKDWHFDYDNNRILRCILFQTDGNLDALKANIETANVDWRNIILQAEYEHNDETDELIRLYNFERPFGEARVTEADLEEKNKNDNLNEYDTDLPF